MQFMLILNETAEDFAQRNDPAQAQAYWGGWNAFIGAMAQAGVIVKATGCGPACRHDLAPARRPARRRGRTLR